MAQKSMVHRDPKDINEKVFQEHFGHYMRCQWCGVDVFLCKFKQIPKYEIRRGWRNYFFCSSECRAKFREYR